MLKDIIAALNKADMSNNPPIIEEPANDFEKSVNNFADIAELQELLKKLAKTVNESEREMRDGICESLRVFYGENLVEGMNTYKLSNGRKLKFTHKLDRKIDESRIQLARADYVGDDFDDLLRVKYELEKKAYDKLDAEQKLAVSKMIETKPAAPTLVVD